MKDITMKGWWFLLYLSLPLLYCCDSPSDFRLLHNDKYIWGHFQYFPDQDKLECAYQCIMSTRRCLAFAVDFVYKHCYLYDMYLTSADRSWESTDTATYVLPSGNIALDKQSDQSSTYLIYESNFGVDGDSATLIHTHNDPLNWWCVDLERIYAIRNVTLINKPDYMTRINGFELRTSTAGPCSEAGYNSSVPCYKDGGVTSAVYYITECNNNNDTTGIVGRYIFISLDTGDYLGFNELEVYL